MQLAGKFGEGGEVDLLLAIAPGFGGGGMDFDEEAVGTEGDGSFTEFGDEVGAAAALTGIDDDGEVRFLFGDGHGGKVEGVAGVGFEGADPAFAKDDVGVAFAQGVFGGEEPFFDFHGEAAFEEDGFAGAGGFFDEAEVLGVAGADLEEVGVGGDEVDVSFGEDFGDDAEAGFGAGGGEEFEAGLAEALEFVGGGARFEGAAAEEFGSGSFDGPGGGEELFFGFDGAGSGHEAEGLPGADGMAGDGDDGGFLAFAAGEFVAFLDAEDGFDFGPGEKGFKALVGGFVADGGDDGLDGAMDGSRFVAEFGDFIDDALDAVGGSVRFDDDDHGEE